MSVSGPQVLGEQGRVSQYEIKILFLNPKKPFCTLHRWVRCTLQGAYKKVILDNQNVGNNNGPHSPVAVDQSNKLVKTQTTLPGSNVKKTESNQTGPFLATLYKGGVCWPPNYKSVG